LTTDLPETIPPAQISPAPSAASAQLLQAHSELFAKSPESEAAATALTITDQQLRALSRKHLFIMIRDLEKELSQAKGELAALLLAYQAAVAQKTQNL